ncbi:MAG: hypothetical protein A2V66_02315 [Ignavibacteria bacterium RBG_13_36_8]|nr:MAG: hypothetical protein A2V66_02315 [Ignavibacteria bacterium RBG_13_36_8]
MRIRLLLIVVILLSGFVVNTFFAQAVAVKQIYWADSGDNLFKKAGIDGSGETTLWNPNPDGAKLNVNRTTFPPAPSVPMDIDVDFTNGIVYGITNDGKIFKCDLDGNNLSSVSTGIANTFCIALDKLNDKLYFTTEQWGAGDIYIIDASLVGGATLVKENIGFPAFAIAVDPNGGKIYFSVGPAPGPGNINPSVVGKKNGSAIMNGLVQNSICKADLNGNNAVSIVTNQLYVYGIDLDLINNKVYWTEAYQKTMKKSDLDGENVVEIKDDFAEHPCGISLDINAGKMYWSEPSLAEAANLNISDGYTFEKNKIDRNILDGDPMFQADLNGTNIQEINVATTPLGIQIEIAQAAAPGGPPVVEGVESSALIYTEGDGAVQVTGSIRVSDPANANIQSATVAISANYRSDQDILHFTNTGGITGTYNQSNGTLTLSGSATPAVYTNALRTVTYENTSENPAGAMGKAETSQTDAEENSLPRMVIFYVSNGEQQSGVAYRYISIIPVNDAPEISGMTSTLTLGCGESVEVDVYGKVHDAESSDGQLTYEFTPSNNSVQVSFDANTGKATVTASQGFSGDVTIVIKVTDPEGAYTEHTITLTVTCTPTGIETMNATPKEYELQQNYPNPFNPSTTIKYGLPEDRHVRVVVYDMLGQQVAVLVNQYQDAGYHEVSFEAGDLNSGIYFYKIESGSFTKIKKMIFLK